ncbi:MAG: glycerophosphodiester phosphodiesterase [Gemmatimonadaceae bacterium]
MTEFVAHRGVHDVYTENTLDAFQRALDLGFHAIELDVHVTADGVCVVNHDESVITPRVALSIRGTYHNTLHAAAPLLPRLDEVLDLVAGRAHAYVEIKNRDVEPQLAEVLKRSAAEASVHSFDHDVILRMRRLMPQLRTGILQSSRLVDSASALRSAEATDLWQWHEFIDRSLVEQVAAAGGRVIAWTVNTPSEWRVFDDLGVAGICTDLPISPTLASQHSSHPRGPSLDAND